MCELSDEEKKAINQLKADTSFYEYELKNGNYIYELFKIEVYKKDVDVILNLIEKQQKEIEELQKEIEKIIQILEAKPYTAYTLYGDILHESDEIAQMLKDVLENNKKEIEELKDKFSDEKRYREVIEKKDYISKGKIKAILKKYKYTEIGDNEKIIEFYKKMQSLLEEE